MARKKADTLSSIQMETPDIQDFTIKVRKPESGVSTTKTVHLPEQKTINPLISEFIHQTINIK